MSAAAHPPAVRPLFVEAARAVVALVDEDRIGEAWTDDSTLEGYSVGGLAAHLCRAIATVDGYLGAAPSTGVESSRLTAAEYFVSALGDHDPIDSDHHHAIRQRSADMASSGRTDILDATRDALDRLSAALPVAASPFVIEVFGGLTMDLDEYLRTRIVELCVHSDDLEASVGVTATLPDQAWAETAAVLVELAALRIGDRGLALGLSRRERTQRPLAL